MSSWSIKPTKTMIFFSRSFSSSYGNISATVLEKDYSQGLWRESLSSFHGRQKPNFTCWEITLLPPNWVAKVLLALSHRDLLIGICILDLYPTLALESCNCNVVMAQLYAQHSSSQLHEWNIVNVSAEAAELTCQCKIGS